jgi:cysteine desulfurase
MDKTIIYLDANASARIRPEVERVVAELLSPVAPRNPSSVHQLGRQARSRLQAARKSVLRLLNGGSDVRNQRLAFTSGGTEACNAMVLGFLGELPRLAQAPGHVVVSAIEHPAVLEPLALLERCGWSITRIRPAEDGIVRVSDFLAAVRSDTALVALMAANNETGALQPVEELARSLRATGYRGPIVSDFVQAFGKAQLTAESLFSAGVNALSISGHKIGAPAGIGALILNTAADAVCFTCEPLLRGGAQEHSQRAGTENLFGALAFGEVSRVCLAAFVEELEQRRRLRERLWDSLRSRIPAVERITPRDEATHPRATANTLMVRFHGCRADDMVVALDLEGVCVSTGSACASGKQSVSHVVTAMGYTGDAAREMIRFSLDWDTDEAAVERAAEIAAKVAAKMRGSLPLPEIACAA